MKIDTVFYGSYIYIYILICAQHLSFDSGCIGEEVECLNDPETMQVQDEVCQKWTCLHDCMFSTHILNFRET